MFDSAVPRYIAFLPSGRLVSIAFENELLVSRGLFNVDCSHKIHLSLAFRLLNTGILGELRSCSD